MQTLSSVSVRLTDILTPLLLLQAISWRWELILMVTVIMTWPIWNSEGQLSDLLDVCWPAEEKIVSICPFRHHSDALSDGSRHFWQDMASVCCWFHPGAVSAQTLTRPPSNFLCYPGMTDSAHLINCWLPPSQTSRLLGHSHLFLFCAGSTSIRS